MMYDQRLHSPDVIYFRLSFIEAFVCWIYWYRKSGFISCPL